MRLNHHLQTLGLSAAEAKKAMASGKVFLRGIPTADGGRDIIPAHVELRPSAPRLVPGRDLVIVHKDADLIVVWKPAGLLAVPARKEGGHRSVVGLVRKLTGTGLAVHRLDEQTSGLMMVARNPQAQEALKAQLEVHSVIRRYLAIASGRPKQTTWTIDNHLVRNRGDGRRGSAKGATPEDARHAITHFERLELLGPRNTLVGATLQTGRTHQVRIHLSEGRNAILGDSLYAPLPIAKASPRLALHACVLGFEHPRTGAKLHFEAPLADDMELLRRHLCHEADLPPQRTRRRKKRR
jgi:23S rRNA pseudouridine1911/1915/1917 synthase